MSGRLDGTAKYYYTSGAVESRMYENGVLQVPCEVNAIVVDLLSFCQLQGAAVKQSTSGEVEERNYVDGKLNGKVVKTNIFHK